MTLGEKIRYMRNTFDLTQEELAEKINVSRQVITKWENEGGIPEISNLKRLAEFFGTSIDYLLDDQKQMEFPLLREKLIIEGKNNYSNRYDYTVKYLKSNYGGKGSIYGLTEVGKEYSILSGIINLITLGVPFITEWINDPAIWFLVELKNRNLIVKTTKETIETRELSSLTDTNKFTIDRSKLIKLKTRI